MYATISEASKQAGYSTTHVKGILKELFKEEEINRTSTGGKILLTPSQVGKILEHTNIAYNKIICTVAQQKGGVGKTTITCNLAVVASKRGARVLVVDIDPESNASSFFLEDESFEDMNINTIKEILKKEVKAKDAILKTRYDYVDIIPCRGNARKADRELNGKNIGSVMRSILQPLLHDYDLILIDQGPSFNSLNVSSYLACDKIFMPVDSSRFSIEGLSLTIEDVFSECEEFNVPTPEIKIIKNSISTRKNAGKDAYETIDVNFSEYLSGVEIPEATIYTNCTNNDLTIFETKVALPKHRAPFEKLADIVLEKKPLEEQVH